MFYVVQERADKPLWFDRYRDAGVFLFGSQSSRLPRKEYLMKYVQEDFLGTLPQWAQDHVNKNTQDINKYFKGVLNIVFEDGSHVTFLDAGWFKSPDKKNIAVLTEHCGYYVFPWYEEIEGNRGMLIRGGVYID